MQIPNTFLPILIWCWLSIFWAVDPWVSLRRVVFTTILILSVAYSVQVLSYRQVVRLLLIASWVVLIADWLAVALFPLAIHGPGEVDQALVGNWRGIHQDKNEAGAFCALCFILTLHEAVRLRSYLSGFFIAVLAGVFLYQTHSKTAEGFVFVALFMGLMARYGFANPNLRRIVFWSVLTIATFAALWTGGSMTQALTEFIEDPSSLTGRVQIWPVLLDYASDHLLFGAGYGSFWGVGEKSPIFDYGSGWVTTIYEAHNGYLDLLVQIGAIGLLITVLCLIVRPFHALFSKPLADGASRSLICAVLAFGCLHDLLETSLLDRANPIWMIVLTLYCVLAKASSGVAPAPVVRWSSRIDKAAGAVSRP